MFRSKHMRSYGMLRMKRHEERETARMVCAAVGFAVGHPVNQGSDVREMGAIAGRQLRLTLVNRFGFAPEDVYVERVGNITDYYAAEWKRVREYQQILEVVRDSLLASGALSEDNRSFIDFGTLLDPKIHGAEIRKVHDELQKRYALDDAVREANLVTIGDLATYVYMEIKQQ